MSGGSLDYVYERVMDTADTINRRATKPLHKAFARHLEKVAQALKSLEWVWSGDCSNGDEDADIQKLISKSDEIAVVNDEGKAIIEELKRLLNWKEENKNV